MRDDADILSTAGDRRRAAILTMALSAAARRRTRRRRVRVGAGTLAIAALVAVVWPRPAPVRTVPVPVAVLTHRPTSRPTVVSSHPPERPPTVTVERIETDPTIADRLALRSGRSRWVMLDDAGLVRELAAAGRPGGVVRINGEARLLLRDAVGP